MAKERKARNIKKLLSKKAPLPTKTEVNKSVAKITGQELTPIVKNRGLSKTEKKEEEVISPANPTKLKKVKAVNPPPVKRRERGRPKKAHGRVKFTTIIDPAKRDELKILAIRQGRNVADILDDLIDKYLKKHKII